MSPPFHLSIPVSDLERARAFYVELLGCRIGRSAVNRMDIDFFGHHIVAHLAPEEARHRSGTMDSEGEPAPIRHFGVILPAAEWRAMAERLEQAGAAFSLAPCVLYQGQPAEQHIMMLPDGCGNVVEFKSIPSERVFATA